MADKFQKFKPLISDDIDDSFKYTRENFTGLQSAAGGYVWAQDNSGTSIGIDSCSVWSGVSKVEYSGTTNIDLGTGGSWQLSPITASWYNKILICMDDTGGVTRLEGTSGVTTSGTTVADLPANYYPLGIVTVQDDGNAAAGTINGIAQSDIEQVLGRNTFPGSFMVEDSSINDHSYSGIPVRMTAGENLVFGNSLFQHTDGKLWLSDADSAVSMPVIAIALESITANSEGKVLLHGFLRDDTWNWTLGGTSSGLIFADTTAGSITQTPPSGSEDQVQVVGVATHADRMFFNPNYTLVEIK